MNNILSVHGWILTLSSLFSLESKKIDIKCISKLLNVIESVCTKKRLYFWTDYGGENRILELIRNQVWNRVGHANKMFIFIEEIDFHPLPTRLQYCLRVGNVLTDRVVLPQHTHCITTTILKSSFFHMESMSPRINYTMLLISYKESIPRNRCLGSLKV
jgi:hypothetical protein